MTSYLQMWSLSKKVEKTGPESVGKRDGIMECVETEPILESRYKSAYFSPGTVRTKGHPPLCGCFQTSSLELVTSLPRLPQPQITIRRLMRQRIIRLKPCQIHGHRQQLERPDHGRDDDPHLEIRQFLAKATAQATTKLECRTRVRVKYLVALFVALQPPVGVELLMSASSQTPNRPLCSCEDGERTFSGMVLLMALDLT